MDKSEIIKTNYEARENEVMGYQINIDNYTLALQKISELPQDERDELVEFEKQITGLLASEKLEQKKSKIMLAVLEAQME